MTALSSCRSWQQNVRRKQRIISGQQLRRFMRPGQLLDHPPASNVVHTATKLGVINKAKNFLG